MRVERLNPVTAAGRRADITAGDIGEWALAVGTFAAQGAMLASMDTGRTR